VEIGDVVCEEMQGMFFFENYAIFLTQLEFFKSSHARRKIRLIFFES
jgi:hypothetical protein